MATGEGDGGSHGLKIGGNGQSGEDLEALGRSSKAGTDETNQEIIERPREERLLEAFGAVCLSFFIFF